MARVSRTENGTTRSYYYDNGAVAFTRDGNSVSSANILSTSGAAIGTYRGSTYYGYLKDVQGSTSSIVKEDGELYAAYDYTDFGETEELTGSSFDNEICYTGAIYDKETGLYYMNARYYDPEDGRFISQDSFRGEVNDPGQWHLYAYCSNNPINYVDPSGHQARRMLFVLGYRISKWEHYMRNRYNTNIPKTKKIAEDRGWKKLKPKYAACHQFNRKGGKDNLKYVSPNGKKEAVYYGGGKKSKYKLNLTEEDKGTYNFGPGTGVKHAALDVAPYMVWAILLKIKLLYFLESGDRQRK